MAEKKTVFQAMHELAAEITRVQCYAPLEVNEVLTPYERTQILKDERFKSLQRELYAPKLAAVFKAAQEFCEVYAASNWKDDIK